MVEKPPFLIQVENIEEPLEYVASSSSILETLEAANIEVPYQCREGFCGACRAKLIEGQTQYANEPLAFVRDGEILLCCSRPTSHIKIELP
ncbi:MULTISPECIES: class I ribonucleotide reductase maintenance protein YfaE [Pseudoalteromonas]|uniref:2Fe-2S ferredoxin-like protein n=1 Tax=Pseudoalteromonas maricaloris TaxID=184924 RepID=A0A8I2H1F0_9GAMM|nr:MULTISPECIES: class I ribonucleotide reductase maintenance protein YfaE [Pseudoalteromonas]MCG9759796.1 class I ribonucleotide reductase maintenance protein YfaE [Pseudoalteromonas sp. Isolate6]NKC18562.1 2Fe-2S ferredoxin-like protein [Pseudoalteromonas galatheae]NLR21258.1 2Fe-2S ferredoxin-like protein [Pseudoalteromonas maricaloris]RXE84906.1 2Fe-2S ferredoxin-like protein [Pseudoalteromonas sp. A757]WOX30366.1 class I ribonucleotide reductase maintenance protein YfaE [Pseudoalteromonas